MTHLARISHPLHSGTRGFRINIADSGIRIYNTPDTERRPKVGSRTTRKVTYSLPEELVDEVRAVVREGAAPSYSAFVERALEEGVRRAREAALARAFEDAGHDSQFVADVEEAMQGFRSTDAAQEREDS